MKLGGFCVLAFSLLLAICQADLLQYADQIPQCGLSCLLVTIPASECRTFTNSTCICGNADLLAATDDCMSSNCTTLERLEVAKIDEVACGTPQRRRTQDIPGLFVIDVFALLCFAMRLYVRYTITSKMEADDWLVIATLLAYLVFTVLGLYVRIAAIGYDIWDLDVANIELALKVFFVDELFYTLVLALARVGILLFMIRVFAVPTFRIISWAVMGWVILSAVIVVFMTIFQCTPISYNWEGWKGDMDSASCIDVNALGYAAAGAGIAQDITIIILPLPIIASLQMSMRKRLQTLFMFSLGIFIVITSCIRLRYLVQFAKSLNPTWDNTDVVIWTSLEVNVTVIVLCLPTLRVILVRLFPTFFGTTSTNTPAKTLTTPRSVSRRVEYEDLSDGGSSVGQSREHIGDEVELREKVGNRPTVADPGESSYTGNRTQISAGPWSDQR